MVRRLSLALFCFGLYWWKIHNDRNGDLCLLYTSDAADERSSVDLGGRRIIKKKKQVNRVARDMILQKKK